MSSINIHTSYNGVLSGQRNMFLLSSVGIVMLSFIKNMPKPPVILHVAAILLLCMAAYIGVKASNEFEYAMNNLPGPLPPTVDEKSWREWKYVAYSYSAFLVGLGIYILFGTFVSPPKISKK